MTRSTPLASATARFVAVLLTTAASTAAAQQPTHWKLALDAPAAAASARLPDPVAGQYDFVRMPPGFHITMGPGAVLWDARYSAEGRYEVRSEIFCFPNAGDQEYGVFVGGKDLDSPHATWTAFVLRGDGAAAVMQRQHGTTRMLVPWRVHSAIKPKGKDEPVLNQIAVAVDTDVVMSVNGQEVARIPREGASLEGAVGFRAGRQVNLHASTFDLLQRLAPPRPPKAP